MPLPLNQEFPPDARKVSRGDLFLHACIVKGRHHNQLINFMKAWGLAYRLNRTLILPDFVQAENQKSEADPITRSMLRTIPFGEAYSIEHLRQGPVSVLTRQQFIFLQQGEVFNIACVAPDGCEGVVPHTLAKCHVNYKHPIDAHLSNEKNILVGAGHLLGVGNSVEKPPMKGTCTWRYLRPAHSLLPEIGLALGQLPPEFMAVHQRMFNPKTCTEGLKIFKKGYHANIPAEKRRSDPEITDAECLFTWEYVSQFAKNSSAHFYVASDNYNPKLTMELLKKGGLQYNEEHTPYKSTLKVLAGMLIDTWVMVLSDHFVGSPLSSMSWNIVMLRRSLSHPKIPSENLPRPDYPEHCFLYPDIVLGPVDNPP